MVAIIVRLKLTLLRNSLRRSTWRTVGIVVGTLYAGSWVVLAVAGLVALRGEPAELRGDVTVLGFAMLTLGWLVASLGVVGVDETVDPARFALLPVPSRRLLPGLFAAALVGIPGVATALIAAGLLVSWSGQPTTFLGTLVAVPLGVAECVLLSRSATAILARILTTRRFREAIGLAGVVLVVAVLALMQVIGNDARIDGSSGLREWVARAAAAASWTPFGWPWAIPADLARGATALAALHTGLTLALVTGLVLGWHAALDRALTSPVSAGGRAQRVASRGASDRLLGHGPVGGVAVRCLRYWRRDGRYASGFLGFLLIPILLSLPSLAGGAATTSGSMYLPPVLLAVLAGASLGSDLAYDGSALWLHVVTGITGRTDRWGRLIGYLVVTGPLLLLVTLATGWYHDRLRSPGPLLGLVACAYLAALGVGCWIGTLMPGVAPPPGASPFAKNSGGNLQTIAAVLTTAALTALAALPTVLVAAVTGGAPDGSAASWAALPVGLASGLAVLLTGVWLGGRRLDRHWSELLATVGAGD